MLKRVALYPTVLLWACLVSGVLAVSGTRWPGATDSDEFPADAAFLRPKEGLSNPYGLIGRRNLVRLSKFSGEESSVPQGWPAEGIHTSRFGWRVSPFSRRWQFHRGVDITNHPGSPIFATASGKVSFSGWRSGYGYLVILDHGNGYQSRYGHNSELWVKEGTEILRGQILAFMGSSGAATGVHIHYEVWKNGRPVNPWSYIFDILPPWKVTKRGLLTVSPPV